MPSFWSRASMAERANFIGIAAFVMLTFAMGGSARADAASQPLVYLAAVALIVATLAQSNRFRVAGIDWPLVCLAGLAAVIAVQLVPLPPSVWRALPGRSIFAQALDLIALGNNWRPISLTPDATLSSLVATLPPIAILLAGCRNPRLVEALLPVVLVGCAASAVLAMLQAAGAATSFYRITSVGNAAVGLFANRNHQSALLVCALPLIAAWAVARRGEGSKTRGRDSGTDRGGQPSSLFERARPWLALLGVAAILPLLLVTGSRAGIVLGVGAVIAAAVIVRPDRFLRRVQRGLRPRTVVLGTLAALVAIAPAVLAVVASRDEALQRLLDTSTGDRRSEWANIFRQMAWDYFPVGSGFGSFEAVFRAYEPYEGLSDTYLNNVHNDLLEIIIEGGLLALVPLVAFIIWFAAVSIRAWRTPRPAGVARRAASVALTILFVWSLVDYPLRTPTLAVLAAVCCLFLRVDASPDSPVDRLADR